MCHLKTSSFIVASAFMGLNSLHLMKRALAHKTYAAINLFVFKVLLNVFWCFYKTSQDMGATFQLILST